MSRHPYGELPKNLGQAVDLSSLGKPASKAAEAAQAGIAINQENLISEIIPASNSQVVIVLCWSPRSAQSAEILKILGELHEADAQGAKPWILATVNVDVEAAVAQALQVQSVPIAIAIIQEQVVPLFESVPPTDQVRMVIDKVLALAAERGVGAKGETEGDPADEAESPLEPEETEALDALEKNDLATAAQAYKKLLVRSPGNPMAEIGLAQVELMARVADSVPSEVFSLAEVQSDNFDVQMKAADIEVLQGNYGQAFSRLITSIKLSSGDDRKKVRDHLLILFKLVDPADPELIKARQALASALF